MQTGRLKIGLIVPNDITIVQANQFKSEENRSEHRPEFVLADINRERLVLQEQLQKIQFARSMCKKDMAGELAKDLLWRSLASSSSGTTMAFGEAMPIIKAAGNSLHRGWMGNQKKCCKLAALAVQFIIAAVLGDQTTLIAGIISSLLSK
ncbi:hypothetical protein MA16_Dca014238 [Dendrobium catenatum]|uniref:Uncharacterized protein n=1 Tax=Dendrobium catenatum TaxID=906689 RepID=A0A2I0VZE0_9ASPA|nr:hypothetical protein MA16_Dca014238 [Dendrobium catenatum]